MTRVTLLLLAAASSTSFAATSTTTWADDLAAAMADADPGGDWQIVPVPQQTTGAKTKADILIEGFRDGTVSAGYHGDITLKRGTMAAASSDGTQALLFAEDVLVCDPLGCVPLVEPASCAFPMCGGADVLVDVASVYLVVDVAYGRDGSETYTVTDILVGFENAFAGVEPDEID